MTFPIDLHLGSVIIPSHLIFESLAFLVGYWYFVSLRKKAPHDPLGSETEWWIIVGMAAGAFIGSRLVAAVENPTLFLNPPIWFYYIGGQTIVGGIAGGILGVEITKKILGVTRRTGDLFVYPLILAMIVGRIGCFLTGVSDGTVGLPSALPWALNQGDGILRHPTSLYEIGFLIVFWIALKQIEKWKFLMEGDLFRIFVIGYSFFRFFEEFLKPRNVLWIGLSTIQLVAAGLTLYYCVHFLRRDTLVKT